VGADYSEEGVLVASAAKGDGRRWGGLLEGLIVVVGRPVVLLPAHTTVATSWCRATNPKQGST